MARTPAHGHDSPSNFSPVLCRCPPLLPVWATSPSPPLPTSSALRPGFGVAGPLPLHHCNRPPCHPVVGLAVTWPAGPILIPPRTSCPGHPVTPTLGACLLPGGPAGLHHLLHLL
eukprot:EG_transcript_23301